MERKFKNKKTIIILTHVDNENSPYCSFVHEHAKALLMRGYNVIVFAPLAWCPIISNFQKNKKRCWDRIKKYGKETTIDGVKVIYKKILSFSNLLYHSPINLNGISYYLNIRKKIKKILKNQNVVFIDAHTFKVEGYAAKKIKEKYGVFTTLTLHGTSFDRNFKSKNGKKSIIETFKIIDYAVCVSEKIKNNLEELNIKNSVVIYNGINKFLEQEKQEKQKFSVLSVGNLVKSKNFDITIKAIKKLANEYRDIHLTIIGDGREKDYLIKLSKNLKMTKNITFTGYMTNKEVHTYMGKNEIFLLPSSPEGFGIVYAEAMSNSCITIGTKGEGIDGFIINGHNGFLIRPDADEIAKLIRKIYDKKIDRRTIIENAQKTIEKITWNNNAKQYIKLMEEQSGKDRKVCK